MQWTVAIGVDTHKEVHVAVALDALGAQLDSQEIATTPAGYRRLLSWARELGVPAFAIEGNVSGAARRHEEMHTATPFSCESGPKYMPQGYAATAMSIGLPIGLTPRFS